MNQRLVSVSIPVLNERESLAELHERLRRVAGARREYFEFLFVDDGSADGSSEEILRLKEKDSRIGLIKHRINHGKSMALMQGFSAARGDLAITMDSDLQDEPENIPLFLEKLEEGYDLVNGWRVDRKDKLARKWLSRVFNKLTKLVAEIDIKDINCGFKGYSRQLYKRVDLRGDLHRLIPAMAAMMGFRVVEIPVTHSFRRHGTSKYKNFRHRGLLDIVALSATWATRFRPFHVFFELALFFWLLGLLGLVGWFMYVGGDFPNPFYRALVSLTLVFSGWCIFVGTILPIAGFVLEQIGSQFQGSAWRSLLVETFVGPGSVEPVERQDHEHLV